LQPVFAKALICPWRSNFISIAGIRPPRSARTGVSPFGTIHRKFISEKHRE
jgi:hypothetical protein